MVLLLARCWDYRIKTEDVLELTQVKMAIVLYNVNAIFNLNSQNTLFGSRQIDCC